MDQNQRPGTCSPGPGTWVLGARTWKLDPKNQGLGPETQDTQNRIDDLEIEDLERRTQT